MAKNLLNKYVWLVERSPMAKNLLNKYVWLVDTIYKAKQITFEKT